MLTKTDALLIAIASGALDTQAKIDAAKARLDAFAPDAPEVPADTVVGRYREVRNGKLMERGDILADGSRRKAVAS